jgi:putative hydrolase of the HAD superfamily
MRFNAVIFDLFGTLVDDFVTSMGQMNVELAVALEVPIEPFMQVWRQTSEMRTIGDFQTVEESIEHVCSLMGVQVTAEQITKAVEIRLRHTRRALEPRPNAVETLAQLKIEGYKLGLLSNCSIEIPILWGETVFANLIDHPVFSSRECLKKPDRRIYQLACERLGVPPGYCVYIADGENHELKAAAEVGMHPVLIRTTAPDSLGELRREAREWQGEAISTLFDVFDLEAIKINPS